MDNYVIGVDFGTDSVRAVLVDATNGKTISSEVYPYPRWKKGDFCDPKKNQFRQHPSDHIEGLQHCLQAVVKESSIEAKDIKGICVDTTGSSPLPVDQKGESLALLDDYAQDPDAMMILWKDHTAIQEADEINHLARNWGGEDFTKYEGGIYSSEWFWAKILHTVRKNKAIKEKAFSWVEHCDFITGILTGKRDPLSLKRSRCAAGHKALWHESWGGLPDKAFLEQLDSYLATLKDRLYTNTHTSDQAAGTLCPKWAKITGLSEETVVAVGTFDAHAGAVGGEITEKSLVKVMGTSTCDIMVAPYQELGNNLVKGICGQVDGSVLPGAIGLEAGQSGFGDVLAWFKNLVQGTVEEIILQSPSLDEAGKNTLIQELEGSLLSSLTAKAEKLPLSENDPLALDWINGRRTPDANQQLKGAIMGLSMGTDAAYVFKALVEAISFGSKKIIDRFREEGVTIDSVIGLGGVAKKSSFVMQTLSEVLDMPIKVASAEQAPALGAAMYASVAAGIHPDLPTAITTMGNGFDKVYHPNPERVLIYQKRYEKYLSFGEFIESHTFGN
ncbi:ribulokinase [Pleomorphovibrio marinus]|uniref:ribulokinase n=1 Tax=Pleomorphovibrio marinus TaxID=2164132 RepID=UPI000E0C2E1E|nr:ribulokinase [Pleomorphovibrio marinus]